MSDLPGFEPQHAAREQSFHQVDQGSDALAKTIGNEIVVVLVNGQTDVIAVDTQPTHLEGEPTIETILATPWGLRVDNITTYTKVIQNSDGRRKSAYVPSTTKQKAYIEDELLNPFGGYVVNLLLALRLELDEAQSKDATITRVAINLGELAHDIDDRIIDIATAKHTPLKNLAETAIALRQRLEHHGFDGRLLIDFPPTAHPGHRSQVTNMHVSLNFDDPITDIERAAKDRLEAERSVKESQAPRKFNL